MHRFVLFICILLFAALVVIGVTADHTQQYQPTTFADYVSNFVDDVKNSPKRLNELYQKWKQGDLKKQDTRQGLF